ncbi:hypothetical protein P6F26_17875 [Roseibacterium sp. SDUM158017]|uniref:hypothetical protein n=1 Tax=Roseicyclus salinarum TaxID=3036773 RepID=UPI00241569F2|nr:hypothetical protein [Roseibacterium sp. SDUM158017]MDG4650320.1 hypothetical protein [Roseibacterium sp. SDUM158017]
MTQPQPPADFDRTLLLVGRLNYSWTNTESLLIHLIAGLAGTSKDTALIIFLTLNTTRARIDLIERLAKTNTGDAGERARILALTRQMIALSGLRNRYNHCIYSFDAKGGAPRTIQMRIADRRDTIKVGQTEALDEEAQGDIDAAIARLGDLNRTIWKLISDYGYPA